MWKKDCERLWKTDCERQIVKESLWKTDCERKTGTKDFEEKIMIDNLKERLCERLWKKMFWKNDFEQRSVKERQINSERESLWKYGKSFLKKKMNYGGMDRPTDGPTDRRTLLQRCVQ